MNSSKAISLTSDSTSKLKTRLKKNHKSGEEEESCQKEIQVQKEIYRNTFKISRHLVSIPNNHFVLKFKDILSACTGENEKKQDHLKILHFQRVEYQRSRTVVPFIEIMSEKMKESSFKEKMKELSTNLKIEETNYESLNFIYKRMLEDLKIKKGNITRYALLIKRFDLNQNMTDKMKTAYRFKNLTINTLLHVEIADVEKHLKKTTEKTFLRTKFEKKQKNLIQTEEESNANLHYQIKKKEKENQLLKQEIEQNEHKKTKSTLFLKNPMEPLFNLTSILKRIAEFLIIQNFSMFKKVLIEFCENIFKNEVKNIESNELLREIYSDFKSIKDDNIEITILNKMELQVVFAKMSKQLNFRHSTKSYNYDNNNFWEIDQQSNNQSVQSLTERINILPIDLLVHILLQEFKELNSSVERNLVYFKEFQKDFAKKSTKCQEEEENLLKVQKRKDKEALIGLPQNLIKQKWEVLSQFKKKTQLMFSLRNCMIPFAGKIQKRLKLINNISFSHSFDFNIKLPFIFENESEIQYTGKINSMILENNKEESFEGQNKGKVDFRQEWLSQHFPFLFNGSLSDEKQTFSFYNNFEAEIQKFVHFFCSFQQNIQNIIKFEEDNQLKLKEESKTDLTKHSGLTPQRQEIVKMTFGKNKDSKKMETTSV